MEWADLLAFIQEKDPAYLRTVRGISRAEITDVETMYAITLPKIYVDFVGTMGASFGAFEPFGATQICEFPALVQELPSESYPQDRLFKVWRTNPGVLEHEECLASPDPVLSRFARELDESFQFIDLLETRQHFIQGD